MPFVETGFLELAAVRIAGAAWFGAAVAGLLPVLHARLGAARPTNLKAALEVVSRPSSQCPDCGRLLGWSEKIPLLGFLRCAGKCLGCRKPIPWRYPLVELAATAPIVLLAALGGDKAWIALAFALAFAPVAALATVTPRAAWYGALLLGLAGVPLATDVTAATEAALFLLAIGLWTPSLRLLAALGGSLAAPLGFAAAISGFAIGAVVEAVTSRNSPNRACPSVPSVFGGAYAALAAYCVF